MNHSDEALALANEIDNLRPGESIIRYGHTIERLYSDTELYAVDNDRVCFYTAWQRTVKSMEQEAT